MLAIPNQVAIALRSEAARPWLWFGHHAFDLGQMLALGVGAAVLAGLATRLLPRSDRWGFALLGLASFLVGTQSLPTSFEGVAERASEGALPYDLVLWSLVALASLTLPLALWLGTLKRLLLVAPLCLVALAVVSLNNFVLDQDYLGIHLYVTLNAFCLLAAALYRHGPSWLERRWPGERIVLSALVAVSLLALFAAPNRLRGRLASLEGAPLARAAAELVGAAFGSVDSNPHVAELASERQLWFQRRSETDLVAPGARLLGEDAIVLLLTVDCLRADLFEGELGKGFRYFERLHDSAVYFNQARAAGSATVPSLSALFSGKHYSELVWKRRSKRGDVWPAEDTSVRFPELLQRAGVRTVTVASKTWLQNEHGVVRGFDEEEDLDQNRKPRTNHVKLDELLPRIEARLKAHGSEPLFLYAHAMDPHSPYDSGKRKKGKARKRYESEVERVGEQLARFDRWLEKAGLYDRTTLILTADHGEAFGEHGTWQHSKTLYDELVHVPLWIRAPGVPSRRVTEPVSLIDLGPTILALFGQGTPASYQGQSLVGFLRGETPELTRPVAAEGRLLQMMVFPDGKKAIFDSKRGLSELYDLTRDPKERDNLAEDDHSAELLLLRAYFDRHRNPVYDGLPPYRP